MTLGAHLMWEEFRQLLSPSIPYYYMSMGFFHKDTQTHAHISPITSILTPFNTSLWFALLAILHFAIVIILMTKKLTQKWRHFYIGGRLNRNPILNAWALVLGHSIANPQIANGRSIRKFSRTLTIIWIILWFLVRSWYEGALYNYLQGNRQSSPYDTIEKVLAANCKIITVPDMYLSIKHLIREDR